MLISNKIEIKCVTTVINDTGGMDSMIMIQIKTEIIMIIMTEKITNKIKTINGKMICKRITTNMS
jgi:hypothetical protein